MKEFFKLSIPLASHPKDNVKGVAKFCQHCKKKIVLKRWDSWNKFLVRCPFCKKINGDYWSMKTILWTSLFINALSFFFTMRFSKALIASSFFLMIAILGNYILAKEIFSPLLEVLGVVLFLFAPIIINSFIALQHNSYIAARKQEIIKEAAESMLDLVS